MIILQNLFSSISYVRKNYSKYIFGFVFPAVYIILITFNLFFDNGQNSAIINDYLGNIGANIDAFVKSIHGNATSIFEVFLNIVYVLSIPVSAIAYFVVKRRKKMASTTEKLGDESFANIAWLLALLVVSLFTLVALFNPYAALATVNSVGLIVYDALYWALSFNTLETELTKNYAFNLLCRYIMLVLILLATRFLYNRLKEYFNYLNRKKGEGGEGLKAKHEAAEPESGLMKFLYDYKNKRLNYKAILFLLLVFIIVGVFIKYVFQPEQTMSEVYRTVQATVSAMKTVLLVNPIQNMLSFLPEVFRKFISVILGIVVGFLYVATAAFVLYLCYKLYYFLKSKSRNKNDDGYNTFNKRLKPVNFTIKKVLKLVYKTVHSIIETVQTIVLSTLMLFQGFSKYWQKNKLLMTAACVGSVVSISTTYRGLVGFFNGDNIASQTMGAKAVNVVSALLISIAVQYFMIIAGSQVGEFLMERFRMRNVFNRNGKKHYKSPIVVSVLAYIFPMLVSSIFSYSSLFKMYADRVNVVDVLYEEVTAKSKSLLDNEVTALISNYADNKNKMTELALKYANNNETTRAEIIKMKDSLQKELEKKTLDEKEAADVRYVLNRLAEIDEKSKEMVLSSSSLNDALSEVLNSSYFDDKLMDVTVSEYKWYYMDGSDWELTLDAVNKKRLELGSYADMKKVTPSYRFTTSSVDVGNIRPVGVGEASIGKSFSYNALSGRVTKQDGTGAEPVLGYVLINNPNKGLVERKKPYDSVQQYFLVNALANELFNCSDELYSGVNEVYQLSGKAYSNNLYTNVISDRSQFMDLSNKNAKIIEANHNIKLATASQNYNNQQNYSITNLMNNVGLYVDSNDTEASATGFLMADGKVKRALKIFEIMPSEADVNVNGIDNNVMQKIKNYANYMRNSTSDIVLAFDVLLAKSPINTLNPYRAEIDDVYSSNKVASYLFIIAVIIDLMPLLLGFLFKRNVYAFNANDKIADVGFIEYEAMLENLLHLPNERIARMEKIEQIEKLFDKNLVEHGSDDNSLIDILENEFKIDMRNEKVDLSAEKADEEKGHENGLMYSSKENFLNWLSGYIAENDDMFSISKNKFKSSKQLLEKLAGLNAVSVDLLEATLTSLFFNGKQYFDYENSLLKVYRECKQFIGTDTEIAFGIDVNLVCSQDTIAGEQLYVCSKYEGLVEFRTVSFEQELNKDEVNKDEVNKEEDLELDADVKKVEAEKLVVQKTYAVLSREFVEWLAYVHSESLRNEK